MKNCLICDRVKMIEEKTNPYLLEDTSDMAWVLADNQFYKGYSIFIYKEHVEHLHELKDPLEFMIRMSLIGETLFKTFHPERINYEILGNKDHHLHVHIIPRYKNDPIPDQPIWKNEWDKHPSPLEEIERIKKELLA